MRQNGARGEKEKKAGERKKERKNVACFSSYASAKAFSSPLLATNSCQKTFDVISETVQLFERRSNDFSELWRRNFRFKLVKYIY